jgi:DNA-directed RNA polymerase beta subunit
MGRGGAPQISVQVREWKPIEVGDKLASRSAQKGCVSQLMPQEDMPFTLSGMVPDLMINPAAFPS